MTRVVKKDGSYEEFDQQKIARVTHAAGLEKEEADVLGNLIATWMEVSGTEDISSIAIRDKVIEEMRKINDHAANVFAWYEETKDTSRS